VNGGALAGVPGTTRVPRVGRGVPPRRTFLRAASGNSSAPGEHAGRSSCAELLPKATAAESSSPRDATTNTRDACGTRSALRRAFQVLIFFFAMDVVAADVRTLGAVGDGQADDTAAIQKAAAAGGAIHFPDGTYRLTKTIEIALDATGFTSLNAQGTARIVMAGVGPAFRFIGTHGGSAAPSSLKPEITARQRMPMADGLEIIGAHAEADGIEAKGTMQLTISRTRLNGLRHGIRLVERNRNLQVTECHIYHNTGIGIFYDDVNLHQSNITGCHISYCAGGGIVSRGGEVRNVHIAGCDIESNMTPDAPETANVLLDSRGGSIAEVAITGCTIQHNSTSPGSANVRIVGPGADRGAGERMLKAPHWGHVTITGNVFSDVRVNIHLQKARGVVIDANTFWEGFDRDLLVESCSNVVVGTNNFERNPGYELWQKERPKQGVLFRDSADCTLTGLHILGVREHPAAIVLEDCRRMHVANCTVLDSDHAGVLLKGVRDSRVQGCFIRDDREGVKNFQAVRVEGGDSVRVDP
jgi:Pectate lyase superfamily protein/Right handed beta helix region